MQPFADDSSVRQIGGLSMENGSDRVVIHGSLDIDKTAAGLELALALKAQVDAIVSALQSVPSLAPAPPEDEPAVTVKNPLKRP